MNGFRTPATLHKLRALRFADRGLRAKKKPLQSGNDDVAPTLIDLEQVVLGIKSMHTKPRVDLSVRPQKKRPRAVARHGDDVLTQLTLEVASTVWSRHFDNIAFNDSVTAGTAKQLVVARNLFSR